MSTNTQLPVKFTKIYTDGYQEDFEFEDGVHRALLVSALHLGHDKIDMPAHYSSADFCLLKAVCVYTCFSDLMIAIYVSSATSITRTITRTLSFQESLTWIMYSR